MTHSEWLAIAAQVDDLWPGRGWPKETVVQAFGMFEALGAMPVTATLATLAAEGREHPPVPGVLLAHTQAWIKAHTPALSEAAPTPAEREQARALGRALRSAEATAVRETWMTFSRHALGCEICIDVRQSCIKPGLTSAAADPLVARCCADPGQVLYGEWRSAVAVLRQVPGVPGVAALRPS